MLAIVFILSLGVMPKQAEKMYQTAMIIFAIYMVATFGFILYYSLTSDDNNVLLLMLCVTMGVFVIASTLYCCMIEVLKGYLQFMMMMPTYVNIFVIYAICNIHDITWGNR